VIGSGAYIYDGINIMKLKVSFFTMKEKLAIRVALLLSFLVLVTKGKTIRNTELGQDNSCVLPYLQVKKTIQV
jgi:hypothetical protein